MKDRRAFLKSGAAAVAAGALNLNPRAMGANETITLALIGGRNQGWHVARRIVKHGSRVKTFCDVDEAIIAKRMPEFEQVQGRKPQPERDFRRVLEDKDIDAVIIGVPDHWHTHIALLACQAGKDVYVEKPLSQRIREGHLIREAARKYKRVVQVGTQRRSGRHFQSAAEYVASGKLGKVCLIKAWMCQVRKSIGNPPDEEPPPTVDYDMWLGPAPKRPFNRNRFHYNWRFFWDYGNSELGNQGVHMLDTAMMAIQKLRRGKPVLPGHVSSNGGIYWLHDAKEVPDTQVTTYDYGDFLLVWELRSFARHHPIDGTVAGTSFHGTEGTLVVNDEGWKVYDKDGKVAASEKAAPENLVEQHGINFLECIKSRKRPHADVELGRLSTTLCHLGNISQWLGRSVKFDPKTETFPGDEEATRHLTKEYRAEYPLPRV